MCHRVAVLYQESILKVIVEDALRYAMHVTNESEYFFPFMRLLLYINNGSNDRVKKTKKTMALFPEF